MNWNKLALDERVCGRVLVLGVSSETLPLVLTLLKIDRVDEVRVIDPDWDACRQFKGLERVLVQTDEFEDALSPPVLEHDCAFVMKTMREHPLDFAKEAWPLVNTLVNRGWVPKSSHVFFDRANIIKNAVGVYLADEMKVARTDPPYLEHLALDPSKSDVRQWLRPFFKFVQRKVEVLGHERVFRFHVLGWVAAYAEVAMMPNGAQLFEAFVDIDAIAED